jgi:AcrR family transcriptional regulator
MQTESIRKQEIRIAAARLFREKGFTASSVRDIANAVGLGAASLYNHIGSKDELLTSICFRCAVMFSDGMKEIDSRAVSPVEKLEALIRLHINIALHDNSSITVFNDEWRHLQEPALSEFLTMRRAYERTYLRIIQDGIDQGLFIETDPQLMYQVILSSLRWLHMPGVKKTKLTEDQLATQIINILIKGIRS